MSKLLLLVHSTADIEALPAAATAIKGSNINRVMVLHSPAIVVRQEEAASKLDAEIADLAKAERQAAERADYEAAQGYKAQRDGKLLCKL